MAFWAVPNRTRAVDGENGIELYGDFQADEANDLASSLDGVTIAAGSTTQIIKTTELTFVTLGTDGIWYPEQSDSASTLSAPLSNPLTLGKTVKPAVIEPENFEPDETEEQEIEQSDLTESEVAEDA